MNNKYIIHEGVDLHKKFFTFFSYNEETGETKEGKVHNDDPIEMERYLMHLDGKAQVAVEACRNWYWFVDMLQERGIKVWLSNPKQTKAIGSGRLKSDKVDARMLSHLLRADLLPICWIPEKPQRDLREILRFRMKIVWRRAQLMNLVRSYLSKENIHSPFTSIWKGSGRRWLEEVELKSPHNEMKESLLKMIDQFTEVIEKWNKKIEDIGEMPEGIEKLLTIPYVGYIRGLTILMESGPFERFLTSKKYVAYCGLAPTTKESGGRRRQGGLSKEANLTLKWVYIEIANKAWKVDADLVEYFHRIQFKKGKNIAKISLARKLAKGVYHMMRNNIDFKEYKERYLAR